MRLWTINFKYLDAKGLVALWREALLAKNVLEGLTKGYKNHPQLIRFYTHQNSIDAINAYLLEIYKEACARGYKFDVAKVGIKTETTKFLIEKVAFEARKDVFSASGLLSMSKMERFCS